MKQMVWLCLVLTMAGCATPPDRPAWGAKATLTPGWSRLGHATIKAVRSPLTWAPLITAGLLQIDDTDQDLADWSSDHTPIFGSRDSADTAGEIGLASSLGLYAATGLAVPSYQDDWYANKAKGLAVGAGALAVTKGVTEGLKRGFERQRPDDSGDDSLPSGHAALTATAAVSTTRNIERLPISRTSRFALDTLAVGLSAGTSYARVASGEHYPSDVLVGTAIGHFIGVIANDAFLGLDDSRWRPTVGISRRTQTIGFQGHF